jgi:DMSO/TMAO reductase YedYZ molybdopterin-dependent catalytic subunit
VKRERGILDLYADDPERADAILWDRRGFLKAASAAAMAAAIGAAIPFARHLPAGVVPIAFADGFDPGAVIVDKSQLRVLNDRPLNAETPPHLLDDAFTPNHLHYVRNSGLPPQPTADYFDSWRLRVDGEVERELELSLADLKRMPQVEHAVVVECAGNGRAGVRPAVSGLQWTIGAVGCAIYQGVRVRDALKDAGVKRSAIYTGYYGADTHLSGDPGKVTISRGTPIGKALHPDTLLVYEMNGAPLPLVHGAPVRMLCPGWPGSTSGKWLKRLWIRDRIHDGEKMKGMSYRVPSRPVYPGSYVNPEDMHIIERMPVKSIITRPKSNSRVPPGKIITIRGHAWSGERSIRYVHISTDFGATWISCRVNRAANPHAWQRWTAKISFPQPGYFELWARATDSQGEMQPMVVPGWNPRGYLNNAMHRVSILVG